MNKIVKYMALAAATVSLYACNDTQGDLLEPKVYFESSEYKVEIQEGTEMAVELSARATTPMASSVQLTYAFGTQSDVDAFNAKNGTEYLLFDLQHAQFESTEAVINSKKIYAEKVNINLTGLDRVEDGKTYVIPVRIANSSAPLVSGGNVTYYVVSKPVRIMSAVRFSNGAIYVPIPQDKAFKSITYEALIYIDYFGDNNTVMGKEGTLIFRIGDEGGGLPRNILQIAGKVQFQNPNKLESKKWYHVAFVRNAETGFAGMYVNGVKVNEGNAGTEDIMIGGDGVKGNGFFIGKVAGFMWGERPFNGKMSEVRLWSVARSENQLQKNMLAVDPKSEGLEFYYKLNKESVNGLVITDASGHMNGESRYGLFPEDLDAPIEIK